ncbi:MAG: SCP2 sterol-binding domain-containing protein [Deltaproteobacteria bacterium]|nr:SCP2 sterol-binding domain-containing protein [Deltaproteobacteria bacterium]
MDEAKKRLANELIDVEVALAHEYPEVETSYEERDLLLYALGVGAGSSPADLRYAYENHARFAALPTFIVVPALNVALADQLAGECSPGLNFGFDRILHSVQRTELKKPLPTRARLKHRRKVSAIYDKTKYAVVVSEVRTWDESGQELAVNEFTMTVRGAGGFGGAPGPSAEVNLPPLRPPDAEIEQGVRDDQALLYRLSGDRNPLHVDPEFAADFGLPKPILHGLCTYGFAARHVLRAFGQDDPALLRSIRVKFSTAVYPGETLVTQMWRESDARVVFQSKVKERNKVVLGNAAVELAPGTAAEVPPPAKAARAPGAQRLEELAGSLGTSLVSEVGAVIQLRLQEPASDWVVDLKNPPGAVRQGIALDADATLQLADADLLALLKGTPVKDLLSQGKLRVVGGDTRVVHKLGRLARSG